MKQKLDILEALLIQPFCYIQFLSVSPCNDFIASYNYFKLTIWHYSFVNISAFVVFTEVTLRHVRNQ